MNAPAISVIMPVYNTKQYVLQAVNSILEQSFQNFEFIIVDDASTDDTPNILNEMLDSRIILLKNNEHSGNYKCRNRGVDAAKGKYICVMDADDIAYPDRLSKQYHFMESNSQYMAVGSDIEIISNDTSASLFRRLRNSEEIEVHLLKNNVCTHPTLIIRKEVFEKHRIRYDEDYIFSSDYDLMINISRIGAITNIPEPLLQYRKHEKQISCRMNRQQMMYADQIRLKQLNLLKMRPSVDETIIHLCLMNELPVSESRYYFAEKWCNKLLVKNHQLNIYNQDYLYNFLEQRLKVSINKGIK